MRSPQDLPNRLPRPRPTVLQRWERTAAAVRTGSRSFAVFAAAIAAQLTLVACVGAVRERSPAGGVAVLALFVIAVASLRLYGLYDYRPSARQGEAVDTSTSHIGFSIVHGRPPHENPTR